MTHKVKSLVVGGLMAGSLFMAVVPAIARDWHGNDRDHRWDDHYSYRDSYRGQDNDWYDPSWGRLRGSRSDMEDLQQARQQALYDASHHASRSKIAQDDAVVDEILNRMQR